MFIIVKPNLNTVYYVEDFEDKPDDEMEIRAAKKEPRLYLWNYYSLEKCDLFTRRIFTVISLVVVFMISIFALNKFNEVYTKPFLESDNLYLNTSNNC